MYSEEERLRVEVGQSTTGRELGRKFANVSRLDAVQKSAHRAAQEGFGNHDDDDDEDEDENEFIENKNNRNNGNGYGNVSLDEQPKYEHKRQQTQYYDNNSDAFVSTSRAGDEEGRYRLRPGTGGGVVISGALSREALQRRFLLHGQIMPSI